MMNRLSIEANRLLVRFGGAKLMRQSGGEGTLMIGGSRADQAELREWISLFMHEAVPQAVPRKAAG